MQNDKFVSGVILLACFYTTSLSFVSSEAVTLTVLHTNDVHSRFLQADQNGGTCREEQSRRNQCYGGFARLHYKVKEIRESHKNVVYLSGGDYYQGTVWYTLHKWRIVSKLVNILNHTAMALGNHEFDDNMAGLVPFLEAATFPIISCNIDDSKEPSIQGKYQKSVVVEIEGGRRVGIIGYTTPETTLIADPGKLVFLDVVESIKRESERLYNSGVRILIAVGHAGFEMDQLIAGQVPRIDLVVGGHTNTFLYNGDPPDIEKSVGDYPTVIVQPGGRRVPVVQAYAFGKYLGYLNLTIDDSSEVIGWNGNPILLNSSVPEDQLLLKEIQEWGANVTSLTKLGVGTTTVFLEGSSRVCRLRECNLGNLVADSMVEGIRKFGDGSSWADVTMAIQNSGSIRSSIDDAVRNGTITMDDILSVLPYQNTIDLMEIRGKHLRQVFEFSVEGYDPTASRFSGKFLQVSGIRVVFDLTKPKGSRVKRIEVRCHKCLRPTYQTLNDTAVYKVAVPTYLVTGGDGFTVIKNNIVAHHVSGMLDSDLLINYIKANSPVGPTVEGRIVFENSTDVASSSGIGKHGSQFFSMLLKNIFCMF